MAELRFTLMGEGSTDRALLPIIRWLLQQHLASVNVVGTWADRAQIPVPQPRTLPERIISNVLAFQCNVLFVHRDADRAGRHARVQEIERAIRDALQGRVPLPPAIAVVPVRETEAWLLFEVDALRTAAGNSNGSARLVLPRLHRVEGIADPKLVLNDLIRTASELRGRHLDRLVIDPIRVANAISDFSPLRQLPAFRAFEDAVRDVIKEQGWPGTLPDQP